LCARQAITRSRMHIGKVRLHRRSLPMINRTRAIKGSLRRPTAALDGLSGAAAAEDINQSAKQNQWINHFA